MAIFGNLEHHPLGELFKILQTQTGTLYFHEAYQGRTLELLLHQGILQALYVDGFPVQETERALAIIHQLQHQQRGAFEFQRRDGVHPTASFAVPLQMLLRDVAFTTAHTIPPDQLPHPDTRFVASTAVPLVPPSLQHSWSLLAPYLAQGTSATDLAQVTRHALPEIQGMLHHLRAVDLISPVRAVPLVSHVVPAESQPETTVEVTLSSPVAPPTLLKRMLGALRRLTGSGAA